MKKGFKPKNPGSTVSILCHCAMLPSLSMASKAMPALISKVIIIL